MKFRASHQSKVTLVSNTFCTVIADKYKAGAYKPQSWLEVKLVTGNCLMLFEPCCFILHEPEMCFFVYCSSCIVELPYLCHPSISFSMHYHVVDLQRSAISFLVIVHCKLTVQLVLRGQTPLGSDHARLVYNGSHP